MALAVLLVVFDCFVANHTDTHAGVLLSTWDLHLLLLQLPASYTYTPKKVQICGIVVCVMRCVRKKSLRCAAKSSVEYAL